MEAKNIKKGKFYVLNTPKHKGLVVKVVNVKDDDFEVESVENYAYFYVNSCHLSPYTASSQYIQKKKEITSQIEQLQTILKEHEEKFKNDSGNWFYVNSLDDTQKALKEIIGKFSSKC